MPLILRTSQWLRLSGNIQVHRRNDTNSRYTSHVTPRPKGHANKLVVCNDIYKVIDESEIQK